MSKSKKYKICLDPGHGGTDPGACHGSRKEAEDVLKLALRVGKILTANGQEVCYTRTKNIYTTPSGKARCANDFDADYFVSIHRNASSKVNSASGVEVLVYANTGIKGKMAEMVCKELEKRVGFKNRGVKIRTDLAVLRGTKMPAILVEVGFINSIPDNKLFDEKFYTVSNAIAKGLLNSLDLPFKTITELGK